MKKFGLTILIVSAILCIWTSCRTGDEQSTSTVDSSVANGNEEALILIKTEPKVREAIITDANVLYVFVDDDGMRRDGYASYLCEILREKDAKANRVKVVEGKFNDRS